MMRRSKSKAFGKVYKIRVDPEVAVALESLSRELGVSEAMTLAFALNLGTAALIKVASDKRKEQEVTHVDSSETQETNQ